MGAAAQKERRGGKKDKKEKEVEREEKEKENDSVLKEKEYKAKDTEIIQELEAIVRLHHLCETLKQQQDAFNFSSGNELDNMDTIMEVLKNTEEDALKYNDLIQQSSRVITFLRYKISWGLKLKVKVWCGVGMGGGDGRCGGVV